MRTQNLSCKGYLLVLMITQSLSKDEMKGGRLPELRYTEGTASCLILETVQYEDPNGVGTPENCCWVLSQGLDGGDIMIVLVSDVGSLLIDVLEVVCVAFLYGGFINSHDEVVSGIPMSEIGGEWV